MLTQPISVTFDIGGGRMVSIETGKLARQAHGAVTVKQGNCIILATVVANKEPKEGQSFFPLVVDYNEKFAAAGRIPGSFFKREGRLSDYEVLISRLIDRALRPLFPEDYFPAYNSATVGLHASGLHSPQPFLRCRIAVHCIVQQL